MNRSSADLSDNWQKESCAVLRIRKTKSITPVQRAAPITDTLEESLMNDTVLEAKDISLVFPDVTALSHVNFSILTGEIHALVGANGAGKSSLMKVLAGAKPTYTGDIFLNNKKIEIRSPAAAKKFGIQIVYQEVDTALINSLSVAENIMLNDMIMNMHHRQFINWSAINKSAKDMLNRLKIDLDVRRQVQTLSLAQKQMVLIARAIQSSCKFLLLDEPTAPLSTTETEDLFATVRNLVRQENIAVVFISHRINEILQICTKYTVMRNGEIVADRPVTSQTSTKSVIEEMLGRPFEEEYRVPKRNVGDKAFIVNDLTEKENKIKNVSLYIRKGEIIGIAGLVGAGKSELCKTIFGALKKKSGTIMYNGKYLKIRNPSDAVKYNIALVPEERRKEGVLINESVHFNLSAANLETFCRFSFIIKKLITLNAKKFIDLLSIKTSSAYQKVLFLSGGNQQKVVVGKWLSSDAGVYIFDEPTKGIDVGAKQEIFKLINTIAEQNNCVIYATCENSELLAITDRIYVMCGGEIAAELNTAETSDKEIMYYAVGSQDTYGQK